MKINTKKNKVKGGKSSFKWRRIHYAVLLAFGPTMAIQAGAQSYVNYDGSKASDLNAALATWTENPEFKYTAPGLFQTAPVQGDWGLGAMNAQYAYTLGYSGKGVKLGSVDSGLLLSHEEFARRGNVTAITISGTYLNDGSQIDVGGLTWKAGDTFSTPGSWNGAADLANHVGKNDNHGSHVSGTIAAAKNGLDANGQGMMGVAFGSSYYITNSNGTDGSIYGSNMDYNYFYEAYGQLAKAGVRVINSSWGTPDSKDNVTTPGGMLAAYRNVERMDASGASTKKSWLDAAIDVSKQTGAIQVFAAGNKGYANPNIRASVPYFRPDIEKYWVAVAAVSQDLTLASFSNACGVAKYWCISAPGVDINSLETTDAGYVSESGTSMAAPHATGAMGILMERYPYLDNQAIRTILLTTAKHLGDGPVDVPNAKFGWGIPDLQKGMNGPVQFTTVFNANLGAGVSDMWSNNISEAASIRRKSEDAAEVARWKAIQQNPATAESLQPMVAAATDLLKKLVAGITAGDYATALAAVQDNPVAIAVYNASGIDVYRRYIAPGGAYNSLLASWLRIPADAAGYSSFVDSAIFEYNQQLPVGLFRVPYLSGLTEADYVGSLVKSGAGSLTLTGDNSYSGGTQLQGGTLGVGSSTALGTGTLAMSDATTLQAAADGLSLANAVTLSGIGNIDTQAYGLTLTGAMTDGATAGGLAKLGTGMLTLSGANTYSGATGVINGTLRAGSATGFSPRSAFFVDAKGQLDLANFDQSIGSLSGSGNVSLGTATLNTGADNSSTMFSGQIAGSGGLAKTGRGTFTLDGANVYSGATVVAAGTLQAGAVNTFSAASAMTVNTGATLNLAGYNQRVAGMNLAGTVVVSGATPGTVLTVAGSWVGNGGLLKLGTVSPSVSDHVLLSGPAAVASGLTTVQVGNFVGLGGATVGNGIELIGAAGGASVQGNAFVLAGGHVDAGAYEYRLNNIGSGGYLSSASARGQTYYRSEVPQYAALPAQLRQAGLAMLGNMHQRAGDDDVKAASGKPSEGSIGGNSRRGWGRLLSTNLDIRQRGTVSPESHGRLDGFQAGTDLLSIPNWRAGVYVGQLDGEMGVSGFVRGVQGQRVGGNSLHNQYLGAYGTYTSDNGLYADAVLQSGRHSYNFVNPSTQSGSAGGGKGRSLLASVEVGQSLALGGAGDWKVEPQLQLIHQRLSLDDATLAGSTRVRLRPDSAWLARLGVRVKGEMGVGAGRLQPYARFNVYRASGGNDVASFIASGGRTAIASSTGGASAELAAGATLALTPTFGLYAEIGKLWSAGGNTRVKSSLQGSAGARVLW